MCVICISEVEVLEKDLIAYKVVKQEFLKDFNKFISRFIPQERDSQDSQFGKGTILNYEFDKETVSRFEGSHGIYCYEREQDTKRTSLFLEERVVRVLIPKGTKIKRAKEFLSFSDSAFVILAEAVILLEVL